MEKVVNVLYSFFSISVIWHLFPPFFPSSLLAFHLRLWVLIRCVSAYSTRFMVWFLYFDTLHPMRLKILYQFFDIYLLPEGKKVGRYAPFSFMTLADPLYFDRILRVDVHDAYHEPMPNEPKPNFFSIANQTCAYINVEVGKNLIFISNMSRFKPIGFLPMNLCKMST